MVEAPVAPAGVATLVETGAADLGASPTAALEALAEAVAGSEARAGLDQAQAREDQGAGEPITARRPAVQEQPSGNGARVLVPEAVASPPVKEPEAESPPARIGRSRGRRGRGAREPEPAAPIPAAVADLPQAETRPPRGRAKPAVATFVQVPTALVEGLPAEWEQDLATEPAPVAVVVAAPEARETPRPESRGRARRRDEREPIPAPSRRAAARETGPYKEILMNVDDRETRIAVIEQGRLMELFVEREERVVGGVYKGRVCNVLPGMDAAFVDIGLERNAFLYVGDVLFETKRSSERRTSREAKIQDVVRSGQELLLQVVKGPRGTKGSRVSTRISLPGRYLVLMPDGHHIGVSRKIEDAGERSRLRRCVESLRPEGFGLISRTEAEGRTEEELAQDLAYLERSWADIQTTAKKVRAPALVHDDLGIILKTVRDIFGSDVDKLIIDDEKEYRNAVEMLEVLAPELVARVHLHDRDEPIFSQYGIEDEIQKLLRPKVWLKSGGYLLVDTTEALTTFDVNTGKFVGSARLADTIVQTNLEAVAEIGRQLRLRDLGGMIVLDFIDMDGARDRQSVMTALDEVLKKDRTRTKVAHISPLGLVEMTRKRTDQSLTDVLTQSCPYCEGRGRIWAPETMAIQIEREIKRRCAQEDLEAVLIYCNPEVAIHLIGPEGENLEAIERRTRRPIYVRANHDFHVEKYEISPCEMMEMEQDLMEYHGGQVVEAVVSQSDLITPPRAPAWVDGYFVDLDKGVKHQGERLRIRLTDVRRSYAIGEPVPSSRSVDRSEPI